MFTPAEGLSDDTVLAIFEDREASLWIGTVAGGLNRLKDGKFTAFTHKEGPRQRPRPHHLRGPRRRHLARDARRRREPLPRRRVHGVRRRRRGSPGTSSGRSTRTAPGKPLGRDLGRRPRRARGRRASARSTRRTDYRARSSAACTATGRARSGSARTPAGSSRSATASSPSTAPRDGLTAATVLAILEDRDGNLWLGTEGGGLWPLRARTLHDLHDRRTGSRTTRSSRSTRTPTAASGSGPTAAGSIDSRTASSRRFTRREGLFDDVQYAILEDGRGNLWMSCSRGIFRVRRARSSRSWPRGSRAAVDVGVLRPRGRDALGRVQRLLAAGRLEDPRRAPLVSDDRGRRRDRSRPDPDEHAGRRRSSSSRSSSTGARSAAGTSRARARARRPRVPLRGPLLRGPRPRQLPLHARGLRPGVGRRRDSRRVAFYTNIPPGRYTFRVQACNNDGVWSETERPRRFSSAAALPPDAVVLRTVRGRARPRGLRRRARAGRAGPGARARARADRGRAHAAARGGQRQAPAALGGRRADGHREPPALRGDAGARVAARRRATSCRFRSS